MKEINLEEKKDVYSRAVATSKEHTDKRYNTTQAIIYAVLIVVVLTFVQVVIDSFRFSSVTYKEYENRIEERSILLNENKKLLDDIKTNQQMILEKIK